MGGQEGSEEQYHAHHDKIRMERQDQSCCGSDSFSSLESHVKREVMSDDGSCTGVQAQQINILRMSGSEQCLGDTYGDDTFETVSRKHDQSRLRSQYS